MRISHRIRHLERLDAIAYPPTVMERLQRALDEAVTLISRDSSWPKRIVFGQAERHAENDPQTGIREDKISEGFWPGTETGKNVSLGLYVYGSTGAHVAQPSLIVSIAEVGEDRSFTPVVGWLI